MKVEKEKIVDLSDKDIPILEQYCNSILYGGFLPNEVLKLHDDWLISTQNEDNPKTMYLFSAIVLLALYEREKSKQKIIHNLTVSGKNNVGISL